MTCTLKQQSGALYLVATPIGNQDDITLRGIKTLTEVDFVAAEDTRHSGIFLNSLGIKPRWLSLHDHNETAQSDKIIELLLSGNSIALISDAGTPLINDPGYHLVKKCYDNQIQVVPVPGACAAIAALCASGLPTDKFCYEGFIPAKSKAKQDLFMRLKDETATIIFYESTHRLMDSLNAIQSIFGSDRILVLAKELTKQWETIIHRPVQEIIEWLLEDEKRQKGEFVLIVAGKPESTKLNQDLQPALALIKLLTLELPLKKACAIAAEHYNLKKNQLYQLSLTQE